MPELQLYKGDFYLWHYVPSTIAAGIVGGCFAVMTLLLVVRMFMFRTWFSIPFIIGGIFEAVGYFDRIWAAYNTDQIVPYSIQAVLLLIAPALLAASVYMVLGRIIRSIHAERYSITRVRWLTRIFVLTDVLSFIVQSGGASLQTNDQIDPEIGKAVVLVGLFVQAVAFGLFTMAAIIFHVRINREPTTASLAPGANWRKILRMLYFVNGLIMARSIFRIIEYFMGTHSYLFRNEWPLFVFDGELMLLSMAFYAWWYPRNLHSRPKNMDVAMIQDIPGNSRSGGYQPAGRSLG